MEAVRQIVTVCPHHLIPPLGLLLVDFCQILPEYFFCQTGLDFCNALLSQEPGLAIRAVADHVACRAEVQSIKIALTLIASRLVFLSS